MEEIWKDIPNYEGLYLISNFGRIKNIKRNKLISICKNDKGYCYAQLYKDNNARHLRLHRLVAQVFIPNINNMEEVNHIDGNKENNCVNNLEWCSRIYNMQQAYKNNLIPPRKANKTSFKKGHIPWNKGKKLK